MGVERVRELPAGDQRNLRRLDEIVRELQAEGEDVHVVYVARGDLYRIEPRREAA